MKREQRERRKENKYKNSINQVKFIPLKPINKLLRKGCNIDTYTYIQQLLQSYNVNSYT